MRMQISLSVGFVTNSSSAIHHIPQVVLDHPEVRAFLETFDIQGGFIGGDLLSRQGCTTLAFSREAKKEVRRLINQLNEDENGNLVPEAERVRTPAIDVDFEGAVVIYGDECESIAHSFADLCRAVAEKTGQPDWMRDEYL